MQKQNVIRHWTRLQVPNPCLIQGCSDLYRGLNFYSCYSPFYNLLVSYFVTMENSLRGYANADFDVANVMARALEVSSHSWEYGTAAEALLELHNPELSVFGDNPFPEDKLPSPLVADIPSLLYARQFIRVDNETLIDGDGECSVLILSTVDERCLEIIPSTYWRLMLPSGQVLSAILHRLVCLLSYSDSRMKTI